MAQKRNARPNGRGIPFSIREKGIKAVDSDAAS